MLRETINEAVKTAMKAQDKPRLSTLRLVNAAFKNADIESERSGKPLADDDLLGLLQKMIKQRQESVEIYDKAGRKELADKERDEIEVIQAFLPQQMSEAEAKAAIARGDQANRRAGHQGHGQGDGGAQTGLCRQDGFRQSIGPGEGAAHRVNSNRRRWRNRILDARAGVQDAKIHRKPTWRNRGAPLDLDCHTCCNRARAPDIGRGAGLSHASDPGHHQHQRRRHQ